MRKVWQQRVSMVLTPSLRANASGEYDILRIHAARWIASAFALRTAADRSSLLLLQITKYGARATSASVLWLHYTNSL